MAFQDQDLLIILSHTSKFLNQNDLLNLSLVSRKVHDVVAIPSLYNNIHITKNPVLRTNKWLLEGGKTYVSGYRSVLKTGDKNDIFVYDRVERLLEASHLKLAYKADNYRQRYLSPQRRGAAVVTKTG